MVVEEDDEKRDEEEEEEEEEEGEKVLEEEDRRVEGIVNPAINGTEASPNRKGRSGAIDGGGGREREGGSADKDRVQI